MELLLFLSCKVFDIESILLIFKMTVSHNTNEPHVKFANCKVIQIINKLKTSH